MGKIFAQKNGKLNDDDRLELAKLLIKAGYKVAIGKSNLTPNKTVIFIEFIGDGEKWQI